MLEARIIAPRCSLYYAAEGTPYDLETLRQHLRECHCALTSDVTLELTVEDGAEEALVADWAGSIAKAGYQVRMQRQRRVEP
jgi:hypothetical protein